MTPLSLASCLSKEDITVDVILYIQVKCININVCKCTVACSVLFILQVNYKLYKTYLKY